MTQPERKFKVGDVVVWSGHRPIISRIKKVKKLWWNDLTHNWAEPSFCCALDKNTHNDCHESNLRLADEIELQILGKKKYVTIPMLKQQKGWYRSMLKYIRTPIIP